MDRFALIGNPIRHSASPALFKAAYPRSADIYNLVEEESFEAALSILKRERYAGANVTAPFKEEAARVATKREHPVPQAEASNLLLFNEEEITAYNTDYLAVKEIVTKIGGGSRALVIGGGGAARAAALALKELGADTLIANRTIDKIERFAQGIGITPLALDSIPNRITKEMIVVYTLPLSIEQLERCDLSLATIIESNYRNPSLNKIECRKYIGGMEWLVAQAVPGFKLFTGEEPDIEKMLQVVDLAK